MRIATLYIIILSIVTEVSYGQSVICTRAYIRGFKKENALAHSLLGKETSKIADAKFYITTKSLSSSLENVLYIQSNYAPIGYDYPVKAAISYQRLILNNIDLDLREIIISMLQAAFLFDKNEDIKNVWQSYRSFKIVIDDKVYFNTFFKDMATFGFDDIYIRGKMNYLINNKISSEMRKLSLFRGNLLINNKNPKKSLEFKPAQIQSINKYFVHVYNILSNSFSGNKYKPIKYYISKKFPYSKNELLLKPESAKFDYILSLIDNLDKFLKNIKALQGKYIINLKLETTPDKAVVLLSTYSGDYKTGVSNNPINLYRGLYRYKVELNKYHLIKGEIDLVDQPGNKFRCNMLNISDSINNVTPCYLTN